MCSCIWEIWLVSQYGKVNDMLCVMLDFMVVNFEASLICNTSWPVLVLHGVCLDLQLSFITISFLMPLFALISPLSG